MLYEKVQRWHHSHGWDDAKWWGWDFVTWTLFRLFFSTLHQQTIQRARFCHLSSYDKSCLIILEAFVMILFGKKSFYFIAKYMIFSFGFFYTQNCEVAIRVRPPLLIVIYREDILNRNTVFGRLWPSWCTNRNKLFFDWKINVIPSSVSFIYSKHFLFFEIQPDFRTQSQSKLHVIFRDKSVAHSMVYQG